MTCVDWPRRDQDPLPRSANELSPGLHAAAERHGRTTTVYLLSGLTAAERRAALRRLRMSARMGYSPRLPAAQLALALLADRIRTTAGPGRRALPLPSGGQHRAGHGDLRGRDRLPGPVRGLDPGHPRRGPPASRWPPGLPAASAGAIPGPAARPVARRPYPGGRAAAASREPGTHRRSGAADPASPARHRSGAGGGQRQPELTAPARAPAATLTGTPTRRPSHRGGSAAARRPAAPPPPRRRTPSATRRQPPARPSSCLQ